MNDYPYMISNNKIPQIIISIQAAAKPQKFTLEFLRNLGFTSTNDRAIIPLFKKLGFLSEDGTPTVYYDELRDRTTAGKTLGVKIKELYSELFSINTQIYEETESNIKGAISRVTGKDETGVGRIYNTFKTLCSVADFDGYMEIQDKKIEEDIEPIQNSQIYVGNDVKKNTEFHYNIQIHLPATTDISVYNAIFRSLKENLLI